MIWRPSEGKKANILSASGGVYELGTPGGAFNFIEPYLKTMFGFIGVTDVKFVTAAGVAQVVTGAMDRETFLKRHWSVFGERQLKLAKGESR